MEAEREGAPSREARYPAVSGSIERLQGLADATTPPANEANGAPALLRASAAGTHDARAAPSRVSAARFPGRGTRAARWELRPRAGPLIAADARGLQLRLAPARPGRASNGKAQRRRRSRVARA